MAENPKDWRRGYSYMSRCARVWEMKDKHAVTKVDDLKQLKELLEQNLINQDEFDRLRSEILAPPPPPPSNDVGRTFGMPAEPVNDETVLRDPRTGNTMTIKKWPTFWLTLLFGCFYLAYHGLWLHAAIALVAAFFTSLLSWLVYPFFAYRLVVDSYQRQGWVVVSPPRLPLSTNA